MAGNLRTASRRAAQLGKVSVEAVNASASNLEELLAGLLHLHRARWHERGEQGVLEDRTVRAFHREAARGLHARGALALYGLRIDGQLVSTFYGFVDRQAVRYYLGGFEPAYARASVGALVVAHVLEQAQRRGAREFDFLRGREPYKYAWGAQDRPLFRLRLYRPKARAQGEEPRPAQRGLEEAPA